MYRHGLSKDGRCPREGCSQEETIRHTFWECAFAQRVWGRGRRVLRVVSENFRVSGENVIGGIRCKRGGRESCIYALVNNEFGKERYMGGKTRVK